ncbi:hypothetical protein ACSW0I_004384, partial [Vibrio fluvialis]
HSKPPAMQVDFYSLSKLMPKGRARAVAFATIFGSDNQKDRAEIVLWVAIRDDPCHISSH